MTWSTGRTMRRRRRRTPLPPVRRPHLHWPSYTWRYKLVYLEIQAYIPGPGCSKGVIRIKLIRILKSVDTGSIRRVQQRDGLGGRGGGGQEE